MMYLGNIESKFIAVVGNLEGFTYSYFEKKMDSLNLDPRKVILVSGGARIKFGVTVDQYAEMYARKKGFSIFVINPYVDIKVPNRFFERNGRIVATELDLAIIFNMKKSGGSVSVIEGCKKKKLPVKIFNGVN